MNIEQMTREAAMAIGQETGRAPSYNCDRIWLERFAALVRDHWLDKALAKVEHLRAIESAGAADHAGTWHSAFEHHTKRHAALCDAKDAILALKQPQGEQG